MTGGRGVICILGDACIDLTYPVNRFPEEGSEALADRRESSLGGSAVNTSICLARLGLRPRLAATVGDDYWGEYILSRLVEHGVDTQFVRAASNSQTQLNVVVVAEGGDRTMVSYRGASSEMTTNQVTRDWLSSADALHVSAYAIVTSPQREAALHALRMARKMGIHTSLDVPTVVPQLAPQSLMSAILLTDVLICGANELQTISGSARLEDGAGSLFAQGLRKIVLKGGAAGTRLIEPSGEFRYNFVGLRAIDATGAGDCLCAGVVAAQVRGLSGAAGVVLGSILGGLATRTLGAGEHVPGLREVMDHLDRSAGDGFLVTRAERELRGPSPLVDTLGPRLRDAVVSAPRLPHSSEIRSQT